MSDAEDSEERVRGHQDISDLPEDARYRSRLAEIMRSKEIPAEKKLAFLERELDRIQEETDERIKRAHENIERERLSRSV